jgi:hypothetical protein
MEKIQYEFHFQGRLNKLLDFSSQIMQKTHDFNLNHASVYKLRGKSPGLFTEHSRF